MKLLVRKRMIPEAIQAASHHEAIIPITAMQDMLGSLRLSGNLYPLALRFLPVQKASSRGPRFSLRVFPSKI